MTILFEKHIENLFKDSKYFTDNKTLNLEVVLGSIKTLDIELIKLIKNDKRAKEEFLIQIDDIFILNQNKLIDFFTLNDYFQNDSLDCSSNETRLIQTNIQKTKFDNIFLTWSHKNLILKTWQIKKDNREKNNIYNQILTNEEINNLSKPKVFTNIKKYSLVGNKIKKSTHKNITKNDNLIIKGNDLEVLYNLKKIFKQEVKLIYIDSICDLKDGNLKKQDNNFNRSTWLTFMKNRLEVSIEFLSDDGMVFVSISSFEVHYLKVLMDEIFGNNFIGELIRKTRSSTNHDKIGLNIEHETILVYAKDSSKAKLFGKEKTFTKYKNLDNDPNGKWISDNPTINLDNRYKINNFEILNPYTGKIDIPPVGYHWRFTQNKFNEMLLSGKIVFKRIHKENKRGFVFKRYQKEVKNEFHSFNSLTCATDEYINQIGAKEQNKILKNDILSCSKPELLLKTIIKSSTKQNDLIMDFSLKGNMTCAVAHKMNRRYICIRNMDCETAIAVQRMKEVIKGEQGGISQMLDWHGGGSFISAELKY